MITNSKHQINKLQIYSQNIEDIDHKLREFYLIFADFNALYRYNKVVFK